LRAISCHVSCAATDSTYDVSGEVALFGTIVFAMAYATTVLADLVFIITKGTVQCCEFAELVTLVIVLTFWRACRLRKKLVN
jgi:hypothetical protein